MVLSKRLKLLKKENELTTRQLSSMSGVPMGTLNKILNGETQDPKIETVQSIANVFKVSVDYILGKSKYKTLKEARQRALANQREYHLISMNAQDEIDKISSKIDVLRYDLENNKLSDEERKNKNNEIATKIKEIEKLLSRMSSARELFFDHLEGLIDDEHVLEISNYCNYNFTKEELDQIEQFKEFIKSKREPIEGDTDGTSTKD